MKATKLIEHLAALIAEQGDQDVYLASFNPAGRDERDCASELHFGTDDGGEPPRETCLMYGGQE